MEDAKRQAVVNPIKITDELIIKYGKLKDFINNMGVPKDTEVTLMYLISALFPTAYKNFEQENLPSRQLEESKQEIEETLDKVQMAFQRLREKLLEEDVLDISTDLDVLETMMFQEGLISDEFK